MGGGDLGLGLLLGNFLFLLFHGRIDALDVGDVDGAFFFLKATGLVLLGGLDHFLDHPDTFDEHPALAWLHFQDNTLGAFGGS